MRQAQQCIRLRFPYTSAKLFRNVARIRAERLRHATGVIVSEARPFTRPEVRAVPPA